MEQSRSPKWPSLEKEFLKEHPKCEACGTVLRLELHHKLPFHLHPELELDPNNLITLCMDISECHLKIGHGDDFKAYNPNILEDVEKVKNNFSLLLEVTEEAKKNRLFE